MKQSADFILRQVAGKIVLVPVGAAAAKFPGMVTMNASGKYIWELLQKDQTLDSIVKALTDRYEVSPEQATEDAQAFLSRLKSVGAVL